ncbi:sensor histidine kinase [Oceanospirillum linum]|uniref:histidine kinase n=1 Tax=Oceanospirillum linum TaxID=966 RepID=A0A1T1HCE4_OCELI|nr:histidine kinase dimerization/phosphoacceptor domain -containing protein [Oceanospirillum linum]OOV87473.1 hypothetical protein BTA35_0205365 [Oceanospirillum linum]SEF89086.1 PAS domain S-box-containing protein [Oleiphilus messinensis]SMP13651.1 PAS domain S-box-containing protein [Oceanospirillum linum]
MLSNIREINQSKWTLVAGGGITLLLSLMILIGWYFELYFLVSPFESGVSRFNTGLMFILLALSLISFPAITPWQKGLIWLAPLMLLIFSGVTFYQYISGHSFGIDEYFMMDRMPAEQGRYPGRPSPATLLCFIALATSLMIRNIIRYSHVTLSDQALFNRRHLQIALAAYSSLIMATASTVSIAAIVWITGSQGTIFGRLSSGQSLLTSIIFLIVCLSLILHLVLYKPFEIRIYWLPHSVFIAFLAIGLVIANNTHDNKKHYFEMEKASHLALVRQMVFSSLDDAVIDLTELSWYKGDPLIQPGALEKEHKPSLIGLVFEKQGKQFEQYGTPIQVPLPDCATHPYKLRWIDKHLLITVKAAISNPGKDLCIHGLFNEDYFLKVLRITPSLKFHTRFTPASDTLPTIAEGNIDNGSVTIGGRQFVIHLRPTQSTLTMFGQDSRAFIIILSVIFGLIAAMAIRMLLKSRKHYLQIAEANEQLAKLEERNSKVLEMAPEAVILVNEAGSIIYSNYRSFEIFGFKPQQLEGEPLETLLPEALREAHKGHRTRYIKKPVKREMGQNLSLKALHANGHTFPVDIVLSPIEYGEQTVIMAIIRDISDKIAERKRIQRDLEEKVVLLKEVYHRVKNNMQVIASLLKMQSRVAEHQQTKNSLNEASLRISALALVHEKLYQSDNLSQASIRSYIDSLTDTLRQSYLGTMPLKIDIEACDGEFEPEVIVPIGLILNELISNAMKHAFKNQNEKSSSAITISFLPDDTAGQYILRVADNGSGIKDIPALNQSKSLGLKLIKNLTAQLKAKLEIDSDDTGTIFSIRIPSKSLKPSASPLVASGIATKYQRKKRADGSRF